MRNLRNKGAIPFSTLDAQPGFVDERGGPKRLAEVFLGRFAGGQTAQFLVNQWQQGFRRSGIVHFRTVCG
jgi:hypothetical protein